MSERTEIDIPEWELDKLKLLEKHAWKYLDETKIGRERLAVLKVIADLVLTQTKLKKELVPQEEVESVEFYEQELRNLSERVRLLSQRRRKGGPRART